MRRGLSSHEKGLQYSCWEQRSRTRAVEGRNERREGRFALSHPGRNSDGLDWRTSPACNAQACIRAVCLGSDVGGHGFGSIPQKQGREGSNLSHGSSAFVPQSPATMIDPISQRKRDLHLYAAAWLAWLACRRTGTMAHQGATRSRLTGRQWRRVHQCFCGMQAWAALASRCRDA